MKKIFTLVAGLFLTVAVFAADHKPSVMLNTTGRYKVVIDGRAYFDDHMNVRLDKWGNNRHTIQVFEIKHGFFGSRERLVNAQTFFIGRNDVVINVDRFGRIDFDEMRYNDRYNDRHDHYGNDRRDRGRDYKYDDHDYDRGRDNKKW